MPPPLATSRISVFPWSLCHASSIFLSLRICNEILLLSERKKEQKRKEKKIKQMKTSSNSKLPSSLPPIFLYCPDSRTRKKKIDIYTLVSASSLTLLSTSQFALDSFLSPNMWWSLLSRSLMTSTESQPVVMSLSSFYNAIFSCFSQLYTLTFSSDLSTHPLPGTLADHFFSTCAPHISSRPSVSIVSHKRTSPSFMVLKILYMMECLGDSVG